MKAETHRSGKGIALWSVRVDSGFEVSLGAAVSDSRSRCIATEVTEIERVDDGGIAT